MSMYLIAFLINRKPSLEDDVVLQEAGVWELCGRKMVVPET